MALNYRTRVRFIVALPCECNRVSVIGCQYGPEVSYQVNQVYLILLGSDFFKNFHAKTFTLCFVMLFQSVMLFNRTAHIRHQCRKTSVLNCHRCLINTEVEKMNNI